MKIIYIITGLGLGGAETQVCNLCDQFAKLGHDVSLVYLYGEQVASPQNKEISVYSIGLTKSPLSLLGAFYRLVRLVRKIKPDVIHSHMVHANLLTRITRIFYNIPVLISTAHNTNEGGKVRMLAYRYTDKLADLSSNVSQISVDAFIAQKASLANKMVMIPNGIDTNRFIINDKKRQLMREMLGININETMIIAVGRNDPAKDYDNLLSAIKLIPNELSIKVFVVGIDTELLAQQAQSLGISEIIQFLGLRRDIPDLMMAADIFVMSSEWEGLPIVIVEAMACECAVVTTDAGGAAQWLPNRDYVVPVKDPEELAKKLTDLISLPQEKLIKLGQQNRQTIVNNFSLAAVTQTWLNIYNRFL